VKGDRLNGGTEYVRWGHDQCPSTSELVYSGRAGGADRKQGGASNPQCLPLDLNFLRKISGKQSKGLMYGAEYQIWIYSSTYLHGGHNTDALCAVCYVSQHSTVYMVPAKYTCPSGWIRRVFDV